VCQVDGGLAAGFVAASRSAEPHVEIRTRGYFLAVVVLRPFPRPQNIAEIEAATVFANLPSTR
jgi:hypothetical protein